MGLCNQNFTLDEANDCIEEHGNIGGRFHFFGVCKAYSQLYLRVGKPLLSIKTAGFMSVERAAKHIKESILLSKNEIYFPMRRELLFSGQHIILGCYMGQYRALRVECMIYKLDKLCEKIGLLYLRQVV